MTWHQACATTGLKKTEALKSTMKISRAVLDAIVFFSAGFANHLQPGQQRFNEIGTNR